MSSNLEGVVIKPEGGSDNEKFLRESMEGAEVGGPIIFPSGFTIEAPPEGYVWHISNGECRSKKKNE